MMFDDIIGQVSGSAFNGKTNEQVRKSMIHSFCDALDLYAIDRKKGEAALMNYRLARACLTQRGEAL